MESMEFRLSQRRRWLRRGWIATIVFLICAAGVATAPLVSGHATGFLVIPGLVGLIVAIISFDVARSRTILSPHGIRSGAFFSRRSCPWPEVTDIEFVNISVSKYNRPAEVPAGRGQGRIRVRRSSGKSFVLAAPRDIDVPDPQLKSEFQQIRDYWTTARSGEAAGRGH